MRAIIIDDNVRERVAKVKEYAELHPYTMDDLLDIKNNQLPPAGDDPMHVVHVPFGFRVVYAIEEQVKAKVRHFSFSVDAPGKLPMPEIVMVMLKEFGMNKRLEECEVFIEEVTPTFSAVNVIAEY